MSSPFEERYQHILRNNITPLLKDRMFARRGGTYFRRLDPLAWVIDIQRSQFNDSTASEFTANCGVSVRGVMSIYAGKESSSPRLWDCSIIVRLGLLSEDRLDKWWRLTNEDDQGVVDAEIGGDIVLRLRRDGLPFLERFHTLDDVVTFLLTPRTAANRHGPTSRLISLVHAGIIAHLRGDLGQREALFSEAETLESKARIDSTVRIVRARMETA